MTTQTYAAVFRDGAFRPLQAPSAELAEGQRVRLVVEVEEDVLGLASGVYQGLSDAEIQEVERIALERGDFFEDSA